MSISKSFPAALIRAVRALRDVLSNGLIEKSIHDLKRAVGLLDRFNITLEGVKDDTYLAAYLLDPNRSKYELERSCTRSAQRRDQQHAGGELARDCVANCRRRRSDRANRARACATESSTRVSRRSTPKSSCRSRRCCIAWSARAESRSESSRGSFKLHRPELHKLTIQIYQLAGREFNIGSPKQVGEVLSDLHIDIGRKTSTGRISTSKAVLEELAQQFELPRLIIDYRELDKLKSVYTDALPHQIATDGRIHCQLNQTVAATGRLSSSDPNLQNIPIRSEMGRRIRRAFVAEKGNKIISADYSQLELRLLAHITQDPVMLEAFQKGEDIHARTARLVFGAKTDEELKEARRFAKIVNFAIAYAIEPWGLSQRVGISRQEAKKVIEDYYNTYKGVRRYMEEVPVCARARVRAIDLWPYSTASGIMDRNANIRKAAEREAINMPIQGTASDIVKIAMLKVDEEFKRARGSRRAC